MINRVKLQITLALFWFGSAYLAMGALVSWEWAWRCAWLNLIIGMIALLLVTREKAEDSLFYIGPKGDQEGSLKVAPLWGIPIVVLMLAAVWRASRLLGLFG